MAASASASRRRWRPPDATSRSGAATPRRTRPPPQRWQALPGKVDTRVCDVTDPASVKAAMAATLDAFGRVDGCFANAGIGGGGRHAFIDRTEEQWRSMFATNLDGVFHVFQAAARHMTERANAGDQIRPAGRDLQPRLAVRHRPQRALRRDQGRDQRAVPGARGGAGAPWASRRTRSCRAGSRAT